MHTTIMEEAAASNVSSTNSKKSPKPRRVNKQKRIDKLSKEQLRLALQKKRECNGKALRIVEELIEQYVDPESFIEKELVPAIKLLPHKKESQDDTVTVLTKLTSLTLEDSACDDPKTLDEK